MIRNTKHYGEFKLSSMKKHKPESHAMLRGGGQW